MIPTRAIRPSDTPTSATYQGLPVPSTTLPPLITRSYTRSPPAAEAEPGVLPGNVDTPRRRVYH